MCVSPLCQNLNLTVNLCRAAKPPWLHVLSALGCSTVSLQANWSQPQGTANDQPTATLDGPSSSCLQPCVVFREILKVGRKSEKQKKKRTKKRWGSQSGEGDGVEAVWVWVLDKWPRWWNDHHAVQEVATSGSAHFRSVVIIPPQSSPWLQIH